MIELPRALQPWAQELELFPHEMATALAPLLPRLDRLVGPLRASPKLGGGEPDGFDGLSRRGIYDRLLVSEWLLADEAPLEFARRAATGEHAFLKLAQREPQGAPLSLVVFDAGPNQLGAPRLVHLAALIVLFRRAKKSGAHFRWSVLQQPEIAPHETLNESNIRALLLARSSREATPDNWQEWQSFAVHMSQMPQYRADAPDCWIVGGERLQRALRVLDAAEITSSLLCVRNGFEIETEMRQVETAQREAAQFGMSQAETRQTETTQNAARQLLVSVLTRENWQSKPREIALDLPDEKTGARLLRDPFSVVAAETRRTSPKFASSSNLLWASATKLMARSTDSASLVVYAVPNSPRAGVGKPRLYRSDNRGIIVAAGRARKAVVVVSKVDEKTLAVQAWGKGSDNVPQGRFELPMALTESRDETLLPCCVVPNTSPAALLVLLPARRLVKIVARWIPAQQGGAVQREVNYENQNALALNARFEDAVFVTANRGVVRVKKAETSDVRKFGQEIQQTFLGWSEKPEDADFGLVAARLDETSWVVASPQNETLPTDWTWNIASSTRIVGVMNLQSWPTPALIAIENERTIVLRGVNWEQELLTANAPIEHASASPFSSDIALHLSSGEVAVWSLAHNAWTLRLAPEVASE